MNAIARRWYKPENNIWGMPQAYRGIDIYPIKIKDTEYLELFYLLMANPKNYIPDYQVVKSSYLKFLIYIVGGSLLENKNRDISEDLIKFLKYITKIDDISYSYNFPTDKKNSFETIQIYINVGDVKWSESDFDNLREIILSQNGLSIEYVESYNPSLEKNMQFLNRGSEDIDFTDEIFSFVSLLGVTINQVEDYTLFQLKKHLERLILLEKYRTISPLEISGQIKSKTGKPLAEHFLSHRGDPNRYDNLLISKDDFMKQSGFSDVASGEDEANQYITNK